MNLKHARYMIAVCEEGSITNAARKLFISQPSLSQMIKLVESNLGAPIFNRRSEPITLTYAGEKYIAAARQVLAINANLTNEIHEINREELGRFSFGISMQRGTQLLPVIIPQFVQKYPRVEIDLEEHGSSTLVEMVLAGELDLAMATTIPRHAALNYILVEKEKVVLLADRETEIGRRIPHGTMIDIEEARDEAFVMLKPGHNAREIQDRMLFDHGLAPRKLLETNSFEAAKRVTVNCGGVMICPSVYLKNSPDIERRGIWYQLPNTQYERNYYLCYRKDLYLTKYMREMIKIVLHTLEL